MFSSIGFIGTGTMGAAVARAAVKGAQGAPVLLANRTRSKAEAVARELGAQTADNETVARECSLIFLGVKPQMMEQMLSGLVPILKARKDRFVLASMAAGLDARRIQEMAGGAYPVICLMPNTPVAVSRGVLLVEEENDWQEEERQKLFDILSSTGRVIEIPDRLMTAAMAISGCGPAFMDMIIEALGDAAVKNGIQRKQAYELAAQTMAGSAQLMLDTGLHPGQLKDNVCSPGGTTIKGVASLEESGLRYAFIKAVDAIVKG